jgi:hypothetical protein
MKKIIKSTRTGELGINLTQRIVLHDLGCMWYPRVSGAYSRSSFRSVRRLMTFGSGSVTGGSYMFICQMRCILPVVPLHHGEAVGHVSREALAVGVLLFLSAQTHPPQIHHLKRFVRREPYGKSLRQPIRMRVASLHRL